MFMHGHVIDILWEEGFLETRDSTKLAEPSYWSTGECLFSPSNISIYKISENFLYFVEFYETLYCKLPLTTLLVVMMMTC